MTTKEETNSALLKGIEKWRSAKSDQDKERAYEQVAKAASDILHFNAKRYARDSRNDLQDLLQAGRIAIWKALPGFREEKGQPSTYFTMVVDRAMCTHVQRIKNRKIACSTPVITGEDEEYEMRVGKWDNVAEWQAGEISIANIIELIAYLTSPRQREILTLRFIEQLEGFAEIGERMNLTRKQVDNALHVARIKLRAMKERGSLPPDFLQD